MYPQDMTRAILNLVSNSLYALIKRNGESVNRYEPILSASTRNISKDRVEIRIRDNGGGIPPAIKDKIFNPFFTTKPPG
jgi:signal transduction histidine kinase